MVMSVANLPFLRLFRSGATTPFAGPRYRMERWYPARTARAPTIHAVAVLAVSTRVLSRRPRMVSIYHVAEPVILRIRRQVFPALLMRPTPLDP